MEKQAKIYVAGHRGLVGSALLRMLQGEGYERLIVRSHTELDLTDQSAVRSFFATEKPEYVFLAAAKVGGILANTTYPADFMYTNLMIESNVIHEAYRHGVKKLLFLGSSCIYPRAAVVPLVEESLLTSELEKTNEPYALAKIAGIKLCQSYNRQYGTNFVAVMPTNLYGPHDNFDLDTSHVLPALIRKFMTAVKKGEREVTVWGSGAPRREFLYSDDMARGSLCVMNEFNPSREDNEAGRMFLNLGTGEDVTIKDLAALIARLTGFMGTIVWDATKPDGTLRKVMDVSRLRTLGWEPQTSLEEGITQVIELAHTNPAYLASW